jgi:hypothetical protein
MTDFSNYKAVPANTRIQLDNWVHRHIPGGDFLEALLKNNLSAVVVHADPPNREALVDTVQWLWNEAPAECWGSAEKYKAWMTPKPAAQKAVTLSNAPTTGSTVPTNVKCEVSTIVTTSTRTMYDIGADEVVRLLVGALGRDQETLKRAEPDGSGGVFKGITLLFEETREAMT